MGVAKLDSIEVVHQASGLAALSRALLCRVEEEPFSQVRDMNGASASAHRAEEGLGPWNAMQGIHLLCGSPGLLPGTRTELEPFSKVWDTPGLHLLCGSPGLLPGTRTELDPFSQAWDMSCLHLLCESPGLLPGTRTELDPISHAWEPVCASRRGGALGHPSRGTDCPGSLLSSVGHNWHLEKRGNKREERQCHHFCPRGWAAHSLCL